LRLDTVRVHSHIVQNGRATAPDFAHSAVEVALRLGMPSEEAVVLSEGMSTVVHLRPSPVVARVTHVTHLIRPIDGVLDVITFARELHGLVVAPTQDIDAGPHVAHGRYVTLWQHVAAMPATPAEAGRSLRALHDAARGYAGRLRSFDPRPDALEIARVVAGDAGTVLRAAASRMSVPHLPAQPVHGDAHLGNALAGGIWLDIDEACLAPPEWDLACLRHRAVFFGELESETSEALAAYGFHDESAIAALDPLVVLSTAAWGTMAQCLDKPIGPRTWRRLDWLRERYSG
jgi:hypothetical protein